MSSTPSTLPPYTYNELPLDWFWLGHAHREEVITYKLTISKVLQYLLEDDNAVSFLLQPNASLNKPSISDSYNQGPYIDIISCSFKPKNKNTCTCLSDSTPSTNVKSYMQDIHRSVNLSLNLSYSANIPTAIKATHGVAPGAALTIGNSTGIHLNKSEFDETKHQDNEKRIVVYQMSVAYSDDEPLKYKVTDLTTIKQAKPFRIDSLRVPPQCATTSFGANWQLKYSFPVGTTQQFKWTTEVRTVFASNDWKVAEVGPMGGILNWIKTVHKIVQKFKVTINADNTLTITHESLRLQRIRSIGYGKHISKIALKENDTKTELNSTQAQSYCTIPF